MVNYSIRAANVNCVGFITVIKMMFCKIQNLNRK